MKKILFVNPPLSMEERYGRLAKAGSKLPPLGLCSLGAVAQKKGLEVVIIDSPTENLNTVEAANKIQDHNPDIVGITAVTIAIKSAANLARILKERNFEKPIVLGGPHVTAVPKETLTLYPFFDYAVLGEGEDTLGEIIDSNIDSNNIGQSYDIRGIAIRRHGEIMLTEPRPFIDDLDELPFPSWDILRGFPIKYSQSSMRSYRFPSACLITSRGCFGMCTFCDTACFGRKIRPHSAGYVLSMIKDLVGRYGIKDICFYDDNFIAFPKRIATICETIIQEKLDITWSCDARIDAVRSIEQLRMLKAAGCWQICYGLESGSQAILKEIRKNVTIEKICQVVDWTSKAGISVKGFFMMGLPLETEETLKETIKLAIDLPLTNAHVTFTTPFPGSELYRTACKYGRFNNDWSKMNMWTPMFIPFGVNETMLEQYKRQFFRKFYFRPRIVCEYFKLIKSWRQLFAFVNGFVSLVRSILKW